MSSQTSLIEAIEQAIGTWLIKPILDELKKLGGQMSELSDAIKAVTDGLVAVKDQLAGLGGDLTQEIQEINNKITAGGVTPADLQGLKDIAQGLADTGTTLQGIRDQVKNIVTP